MKELPVADAPADDHHRDQQCRSSYQASLQPQKRNDQQAHQWKRAYPYHNGKRHTVKITGESSKHGSMLELNLSIFYDFASEYLSAVYRISE